MTASSDPKPIRPTVVFMINSLVGGGAERVMSSLLKASSAWRQHYDLHLILLDREREAYPLPEWLSVHRLDGRFSLLRSFALAFPVLRRLKPVACVSFLSRANLLATVAGRLLGFRAIISERVSPSSHHGQTIGGRIAKRLTRVVYPQADTIICPSAGVRDDLVGNFSVSFSRTLVIANPQDIETIGYMASQPAVWHVTKPTIVAVGRLVENKNFALLLSALTKARCGHDLVILGDGPLRNALERQAVELGLADRVHFPGFVENPFPIVKAAQFFVSSSNAEGFPNALVEAMTLGVPVIATNCRSGPSEILDERDSLMIQGSYQARYGMLVPTENLTALAEAIDMMAQPAVQVHYRKQALQGVRHFSETSFAQAVWRIIGKVS